MIDRRLRQSGFPVPRLDLCQIRATAHKMIDWAGSVYGARASAAFPVVEVIEFLGSEADRGCPDFEVVPDNELSGFLARFDPVGYQFKFVTSVWEAANRGEGWAREHLAHEIGHLALRYPSSSFGLQFADERVIPAADSEHQANSFADELLMDARRMSSKMGIDIIVNRFLVSETAAIRRVRNLSREGYWGKK